MSTGVYRRLGAEEDTPLVLVRIFLNLDGEPRAEVPKDTDINGEGALWPDPGEPGPILRWAGSFSTERRLELRVHLAAGVAWNPAWGVLLD